MTLPPDYEHAKVAARDGPPEERRRLAARNDLPPELLYFLAEDADVSVRLIAAANPRMPAKADRLLAADAVSEVRAVVAHKISTNWKASAAAPVRELLVQLGRDNVMRVRHAIAEALKSSLDCPYELIASLARDAEELVSQPVLEFSPLLGQNDLIDIIQTRPSDGALSAIARRQDLREATTDALVDTGSVAAITHLLRNSKAQIREQTLDSLIDRSPAVGAWQEALVERDGMPAPATLRLAGLLADHLLKRLLDRHSLDAGMASQLQDVVRKRVDDVMAGPLEVGTNGNKLMGQRIDQLRAQHEAGQLDDGSILAAIVSHDRGFVVAALHVMSGLPLSVVVDILHSQSGKAICALAWKSGLHPDVSAELQRRVAHLPTREVVEANASGAFPLSPSAMAWQLELFGA